MNLTVWEIIDAYFILHWIIEEETQIFSLRIWSIFALWKMNEFAKVSVAYILIWTSRILKFSEGDPVGLQKRSINWLSLSWYEKLVGKNNWLLWNFSHKRSPNKPWKLDDPLWYWRYFEGISIYGIFFPGCCHKISKFKWEWQNMLWEKIKTSTRISNLTKRCEF